MHVHVGIFNALVTFKIVLLSVDSQHTSYAHYITNEALKCKASAAHSLTLYPISDIKTSGKSWLARQRFYIPVEFIEGLLEQAVMEKRLGTCTVSYTYNTCMLSCY